MTSHECKKDAARRLADAGIKFWKLTAKTVSFGGFGYGDAIFVQIHGAETPRGPHRKETFQDVPAPSKGGYVVEWKDT